MRILQSKIALFSMLTQILLGYATAAMADTKEPLTAQEICQRLKITEEVLVFDESGERIVDSFSKERSSRGGVDNPRESSVHKKEEICTSGSFSGKSSSAFDGTIYFLHEWTVLSDGRIKIKYEQGERFDGRGRDSKLVGSTGRHEAILKDFSAITWVSPLHKKQRVVVRLVPSLEEGQSTKELGKFPVTFENAVIYDGVGKLWAVNVTADGEFIAMTTVHGGLMLSYQPFPGAKKIGRAAGREIRFKAKDGVTILIKSESAILPGDIGADVYVMFEPSLRSKGITSQSISSGKNAEEVLEKWK